MTFKRIKIIAKEQTSSNANSKQFDTIYVAVKKIENSLNHYYENDLVVKVDLADNVAFKPEKLIIYGKYSNPVWINDDNDPVDELEDRINKLPNTEKDKIELLFQKSPSVPTDLQEKFLILAMIEGKKYDEISQELNVDRKHFSNWWNELSDERLIIRKALNLYNNRVGNNDFKPFLDAGKYAFYKWFKKQPRKCFYCESEEYKLVRLFDKKEGLLKTKRSRGSSLELERKDSTTNLYSPENCVLACYFCNNHKSDLISADEHEQFFARQMKDFIDYKYNQLDIKYDF